MTPEREQEIGDCGCKEVWGEMDESGCRFDSLRQEHERLKEWKVFDAAFAGKLGEFQTVERLTEEYSAYKQKCRELEAERDYLSRQVKIAVEALRRYAFEQEGNPEFAKKALAEMALIQKESNR